MSELVTIVAPQIAFAYTAAESVRAKGVIYLEDIEPSLPAVIYLRRFVIWNQGAASSGYPAGLNGDITVAVDPDRKYTEESGFPVAEMRDPKYLKLLGVMELRPGAPCWTDRTFDCPVAYRRGRDCIVIAPECSDTGGQAAIFLAFGFEAAGDIGVEAMPSGAADAFRMGLNSDCPSNGNICFRNLVPIKAGGTEVRVRVRSFTSPSVVNHLSVGVQSSGSTTTATPVELTFNSASGVSLGAHQSKWSDWVSLGTSAGQKLLVTASLFNGNNAWAFRAANGAGAWNSASDSWNTAAMQGAVGYQLDRTHVIDRVQVR